MIDDCLHYLTAPPPTVTATTSPHYRIPQVPARRWVAPSAHRGPPPTGTAVSA